MPQGGEVPADDVADEEVDVLYLAGQRPPVEGAWLWVTTADAGRGGEFTALFLPRNRPVASGGDVLLHIALGTGEDEALRSGLLVSASYPMAIEPIGSWSAGMPKVARTWSTASGAMSK